MATVRFGTNFNVTNTSSYELDDSSRIVSSSSTGFSAADSRGHSATIIGEGMTFDGTGDWVGGVANAITIRGGDQVIFEATGLSVPGNNNTYDTGYDGEAPGMQAELAFWMRGADTITGSTGSEYLKGFSGNDMIEGGAGNDVIDGGSGADIAVYAGNAASYQVTQSPSGYSVTGGSDGGDTLVNVERIKFADKTIALDISGTAGQAYRLYQAAFDRKPDLAGLSTWIDLMDKGMSLQEVSSYFQRSDEFKSMYGASLSNQQFVDLLYRNVLDRAPDAQGYATWQGVLDAGTWTREQVLIGFSESTENQAKVIGSIQSGIDYQPL